MELSNYDGWRSVHDKKASDPLSIDYDDECHIEPGYGCKPFTPLTRCCDIHHGPIRLGDVLYCEKCGKSGRDHLLPRHKRPVSRVMRRLRAVYDPNLRGGTDGGSKAVPEREANKRETGVRANPGGDPGRVWEPAQRDDAA